MAVKSLKKGYLALAASMLLVAQAQATELLNSSYDVSRELFAALNPPFEQQWAKDNGGDKLTIKQSHAGSSKQALAILQGLSRRCPHSSPLTEGEGVKESARRSHSRTLPSPLPFGERGR